MYDINRSEHSTYDKWINVRLFLQLESPERCSKNSAGPAGRRSPQEGRPCTGRGNPIVRLLATVTNTPLGVICFDLGAFFFFFYSYPKVAQLQQTPLLFLLIF